MTSVPRPNADPNEEWDTYYPRTKNELIRAIAEGDVSADMIAQLTKAMKESGKYPESSSISEFLTFLLKLLTAVYAYEALALDFQNKLWNRFNDIEKKIGSRDNEIANDFELLLKWKKETDEWKKGWDETLNQAKDYFGGIADKIVKPKEK